MARRDAEEDDPFLFAALELQNGRPIAEVRRMLVKEKGLSKEEAQTTVLNVHAAQLLQNGTKSSEVRKRLVEQGMEEDEAREVVRALRESDEPASEPSGGGGGGALRSWGFLLLFLGVGSFILPFIGVQFRLLNLLGPAAPVAGGILAVIGLVLVIVSFAGRGS